MTAILHTNAGSVLERYEQELWGIQGEAEPAPDTSAPAGAGERDNAAPLVIDPATGALEAEAKKRETEEQQKQRAEEKKEQEKIRAEEKSEHEAERKENREATEHQAPPVNIEVNNYAQPAKARTPVAHTSSRTGGGTGRR